MLHGQAEIVAAFPPFVSSAGLLYPQAIVAAYTLPPATSFPNAIFTWSASPRKFLPRVDPPRCFEQSQPFPEPCAFSQSTRRAAPTTSRLGVFFVRRDFGSFSKSRSSFISKNSFSCSRWGFTSRSSLSVSYFSISSNSVFI
jgi:hypothetical protein